MNTFKFIQEGGFSEEKNPKYDPTKKRSKEPETILTSNFGNQMIDLLNLLVKI